MSTAPPTPLATAAVRAPLWLSLPAVVFIGLLFLAPVFYLLLTSVLDTSAGRWAWSLDLYRTFFADSYNWQLLARTFYISLATVAASLVLAFPVALFMRSLPPRQRTLLAIVLLSPLLTSVVVRTLAWVVLLGPKGLLNNALASLGLGPIAVMYTDVGVIIGLTHVYFGYMLLSIMASVLKIDDRLLLAAQNLGASHWQTLRQVVLPLSKPGIVTGSVLVFTMSASAYVTPALLGGSKTKVMATEIYDQAIQYLEWREAAVIACVLFAGVWVTVALLSRFGETRSAGEGRA
ncbi:ABC transporter permease [Ottowia thiooxydans]|uniref:ABC transporter permease n=1 Tax=Ottowia thiooxydans TaxID=219182 RepID=UPI0003FB73C6|nr:ABC transporter permease [Ottowia thiooxydans]